MANFLAKSTAGPSIPLTGYREAAESTDFDKVFKPFALRKGVEVAPISYFGTHRGSLDGVEENTVVVLDDENLLPLPSAPVPQSLPVSLSGVNHVPVHNALPLSSHCKVPFAI